MHPVQGRRDLLRLFGRLLLSRRHLGLSNHDASAAGASACGCKADMCSPPLARNARHDGPRELAVTNAHRRALMRAHVGAYSTLPA